MKTAEQFLDVLAGKGLVEDNVISQLLAQARQATAKGKPLAAEKVADLLIEKEYLTRRQSNGIIETIPDTPDPVEDELSLVIDDAPVSQPKPTSKPEPAVKSTPEVSVSSIEEELGLAPSEDTPKPAPAVQKPVQPKPAPAAQKPVQPKPAPAAQKTAQPKPAPEVQKPAQPKPAPEVQKPAQPKPQSAASLLEEELGLDSPGGSLLDDLMTGAATADPLAAGLAGDPLADPLAAQGGVLQSAPKKKKGLFKFIDKIKKSVGVKAKTKTEVKQQQKAKIENPWDSNLMLIGGGALILLTVVGLVLFFVLSGQSGDGAFEDAEKCYQQASYSQSIEMFNKYLESFPKHEKAGLAKVHKGLALMRLAVDGTSDWSRSLKDVKTALSGITSVNEFPVEAPPELSALLPKIAENLANEAFEKADQSKLDDAKEAFTLLDKYVPASKRPATLTQNLEALLSQAEGKLLCESELKKCLEAMDAKIAQNDSAGAYALRDDYLKRFPLLRTDARILAAVEKVSEIESNSVSFNSSAVNAVTEENPTLPGRVVLAQTVFEKAPTGVNDQIVLVPGKNLFGVQATDGKVKWVCPIAEKTNFTSTGFNPQYISPAPSSDFIMLGTNNTIQRRDNKAGKLKWSFTMGESADSTAISFPLITKNQVFISQNNGQIFSLNIDTGAQTGFYKIPQKINVGACFNEKTGYLYQPAEHTNLFVISTQEQKCVQTLYLGHSRGDLSAAPALIGEFLAVPVNIDADNCEIRFFRIVPSEGSTVASSTPIQTVKLSGHVVSAPEALERRLLVCTDTGLMSVFEIQAGEPPFKQIVEYSPEKKPDTSVTAWSNLAGDKVFLADTMLTRFDVQTSSGRLKSVWTKNKPCVSNSRPVVIGKTVFHVRNSEPVLVSSHFDKDGTVCWQTAVNDNIISPLYTGKNGFEVVTESGGLFKCSFDDIAAGTIIAAPAFALESGDALGGVWQAIKFPSGVFVCISQKSKKELLVLDPSEDVVRFRRTAILPDTIAGPIYAAGKMILVPVEKGQIMMLDPLNGQKKADSFMTELTPNEVCSWSISDTFEKRRWIVSTGVKMYRIGLEQTTTGLKIALISSAQTQLDSPVNSAIVVTENNVLFTTAEGGLNVLDKVKLESVKSDQAASFDTTQLCGLWSDGKIVLATMKNGSVIGLDSTGQELWTADSVGQVRVAPGFDGNNAVLAAVDGSVTVLSTQDGSIIARQSATGSAPAAAPVKVSDKWYCAASNGEIYEVKLVSPEDSSK